MSVVLFATVVVDISLLRYQKKRKLFKTTVIAANLAADYKMATNKYAYSNQGRRKKCIFGIFKINYLPG